MTTNITTAQIRRNHSNTSTHSVVASIRFFSIESGVWIIIAEAVSSNASSTMFFRYERGTTVLISRTDYFAHVVEYASQ